MTRRNYRTTTYQAISTSTQFKNAAQPTEKKAGPSFITQIGRKDWNKQSLYGQSLYRPADTKQAKQQRPFLSWLRKTTTNRKSWVCTDPTTASQVSFYQCHRPNALLMKVFRTLSADTRETDRLKQWLLQKNAGLGIRPQLGKCNTCHYRHRKWLAEQSKQQHPHLGNNQIDTNQEKQERGYIKQWLPAQSPLHAKVVVKSAANAPLWGALYRQYFERNPASNRK